MTGAMALVRPRIVSLSSGMLPRQLDLSLRELLVLPICRCMQSACLLSRPTAVRSQAPDSDKDNAFLSRVTSGRQGFHCWPRYVHSLNYSIKAALGNAQLNTLPSRQQSRQLQPQIKLVFLMEMVGF